MSFAAIVAIDDDDDDDAPGSLLPLLLPLLLRALPVVVVLLKLAALRVLLVLALRGERRSFCKSVRLILFPPNKQTNQEWGKTTGERAFLRVL